MFQQNTLKIHSDLRTLHSIYFTLAEKVETVNYGGCGRHAGEAAGRALPVREGSQAGQGEEQGAGRPPDHRRAAAQRSQGEGAGDSAATSKTEGEFPNRHILQDVSNSCNCVLYIQR